MIKTTVISNKYSQKGLNVSLEGNRLSITKGSLFYDKEYKLDINVSLTIDDETDILMLVEDLITGEVLVAASDGSIDKTQYRLIERLAWKKDGQWQKLSIEPIAENTLPKAEYNYEGLNTEAIKKGLTIQQGGQVKTTR
jgi:hypothetical protein